MPTDPVVVQLLTLRDFYALHLAQMQSCIGDPLYKERAKRLEPIRSAIQELEKHLREGGVHAAA